MRWLLPHPHNPLGIASEGPQESLKVSQNTELFPVTIYHGLLLLSKEKLLTVFTLRVTEKKLMLFVYGFDHNRELGGTESEGFHRCMAGTPSLL